MNKPLVSIIIPVYNVKKYLEECVDSCRKQNYDNYEILLIDDGSNDGSEKICDNLANKYGNVLTYHKPNGGLSDARNYGIEKACGDFVMFVDSDDVISEYMLSYMYELMVKFSSDIAVCNLCHFVDGETPTFSKLEEGMEMDSFEALKNFMYQKMISTSSCAKLFKRDIIGSERFVKGQRFEDNDFLFRILLKCQSVSYGASNLYGYRHRKSSITTSVFSEKEFDIINIGKKIIAMSVNANEDVQKSIKAYQCSNALRIYLTASKEWHASGEYRYCVNYLKKNGMSVFCDSKARKKLRIVLLLFKMHIPRGILVKMRKYSNRWS